EATVHGAFLCDDLVLVARLYLPTGETTYPGLEDLFPCAARMQRAAADLTGILARNADPRPWLRHAAWPAEYRPLASHVQDHSTPTVQSADDYPFVRVSGDGVHEIPVG